MSGVIRDAFWMFKSKLIFMKAAASLLLLLLALGIFLADLTNNSGILGTRTGKIAALVLGYAMAFWGYQVLKQAQDLAGQS